TSVASRWGLTQDLFALTEFFAAYDFDILAAPTRRERESVEKRLLSTPAVTSAYNEYVAEIESLKRLMMSQFKYVNRKGDGQTSGAILDLSPDLVYLVCCWS
ncbi:hypothetical protein K2Z83_18445, partial [Oscillochloris sp. ZM17-4]|uniref:hypothetical protein n=1 Tax=Oscillochloris sp. ZM17-4 TaxID=2866714 RepID=UPI001C72F2AC